LTEDLGRHQIDPMDRTAVAPSIGSPRWLHAAGWSVLAWWTLRSGLVGDWIFLDFVNLAFHEAGHVLLAFAGTTVHYLGGTLGQLLVPVLLAFHFLLRQRQPLGAAFCLWWLGQNFSQISVYMADARELALPLVGGGDHDWNELFFRFGVLDAPSVAGIAGATRAVGLAVMLAGLAWTGWFTLPDRARRRLHERLTARHAWLDTVLGD
jgi:hypothetical protein